MTLLDAILQAISAMPREQVAEWREAHGLDESDPLALRWETLPRWTPEHVDAVVVAMHDWCLAQRDAREVLREISMSSRRLGACFCLLLVKSIPMKQFSKAWTTMDVSEQWIRGKAGVRVAHCSEAARSSCVYSDHASILATLVGSIIAFKCLEDAAEEAGRAAEHLVIVRSNPRSRMKPDEEKIAVELAKLCATIADAVRTALEMVTPGFAAEDDAWRVVNYW